MAAPLRDDEFSLFVRSLTRFLRTTARFFLGPLKFLFWELFSRRRFYRLVLRGGYARSFQLLAPLLTIFYLLLQYTDLQEEIIEPDGEWDTALLNDPVLAEAFLLFALCLLNLLFLLPSAAHRRLSGRASAFDLSTLVNLGVVAAVFYLLVWFGLAQAMEARGWTEDAMPEAMAIPLLALLLWTGLHVFWVCWRGAALFRRKSRLRRVSFYGVALLGFAASVLLIYPWDCALEFFEWPYIETFCAGLSDVTGWPPPDALPFADE